MIIGRAGAQSAQSDGLYYNITDTENKTVEVINDPNNNYDYILGKLIVPESIDIDNETYTVTAIGDWAFINCLYLTEIDLPEGITRIGYGAFDKCPRLTKVNVNEGLTEIGEMAFEGCSALQEINLPKSLTTLSKAAFGGCFSLKDLILPESLTYIDEMAFNGCRSLTDITIPQHVAYIGDDAFADCTSLTEINVSSGNKFYTSENGILFNADKSTLIRYPLGKTTTSYDLPNSVTTIGKNAFAECTVLEEVNFSDSLTHIEDYAFYNCPALKNPVFPESLTDIGICAFSFCNSITEIHLPQNIHHIGLLTFSGSTALTDIELSEDNPYYSTEDGVLFNADKSTLLIFPGGKTSKNYVMPENVTTIGIGAFVSCPLVTEITLPEGITTIGENAFDECTALTEITLPGTLTTLGNFAFSNCTALQRLTLNEGITTVSYGAFSGCIALTRIDFPSTLSRVENTAFNGCMAIKEITVRATTPPTLISNPFNNVSQGTTVYVPAEALEAYQQVDPWSTFNLQPINAGTAVETTTTPDGLHIEAGRIHNPQAISLNIFDLQGRIVYQGAQTNINLPEGIYLVRGKGVSRKVMIAE